MDEPTQLQLSVKSAFRLLVTACDGPTNAARICDAQASHISEASSPNWPRHPRADHIRAMELYLGKPVFTREAAAVMRDYVMTGIWALNRKLRAAGAEIVRFEEQGYRLQNIEGEPQA